MEREKRQLARGGYVRLIAENRDFRRLWYGQIVSQFGDWFDSIALYTLTFNFTGSGMAVGAIVIAQLLPVTFVSPVAGVLVDRYSRKKVMIAADLLRAVLVLLFLFVRSPATVWLIYPVLVLKVSLSAFFEPARNSVIPHVVSRDDIVLANAIGGLTWSIVLSVGAAIGGFVTHVAGPYAALVVDSLSFVLSAACIAGVKSSGRVAERVAGRTGFHEMAEGFRFVIHHGHVALYTFIKSGWGIAGAVLLIAPLLGREVFRIGKDGALSIGLLHAARGVGTALGPVIARRVGGESMRFLRRCIGPATLFMCIGYIGLAHAPNIAWASFLLAFAHLGGATVWVFSTVLLQVATPDQYRGRVFSTELAMATLTMAISVALIGWLHDHGWTTRELSALLGWCLAIPGTFFWITLWRKSPEDEVHIK